METIRHPAAALGVPGVTRGEPGDDNSVKALVEYERFCRDNGLWEPMASCYAQDARVEVSWFSGSGKEFVESSRRMKARAPHKISSTLAWVRGTRAVAIMTTMIQMSVRHGSAAAELQSDVQIVFRLKKNGGHWKIHRLSAIYETDRLVPTRDAEEFFSTEFAQRQRKSYGNLSAVLARAGYVIPQDLAGLDRPDITQDLHGDLAAWLSESKVPSKKPPRPSPDRL